MLKVDFDAQQGHKSKQFDQDSNEDLYIITPIITAALSSSL